MYTGIPLDKYTSKFLFMELIERLGKIKELNKNVKLFIIHSLNYLAQNPEVSEIEALGFLLETIEEIVPQIDERNRINIVNQVIKYAEDPSKIDRKSTRLNSSHVKISYAVFCLKTKPCSRLLR